MANIAASDITVTILNNRKDESGRKKMNVQLAFGDGALTYPAGGIPISKGALGCPNVIESFVIYDKGTSGYQFSYDRANEKIVVMQSGSHGHALHLNDASVADGATTRINAGTNLLGANTGSDIAIAGVADTSGAGGIVNAAGAALAEASAIAIAAQTIKCEITGW